MDYNVVGYILLLQSILQVVLLYPLSPTRNKLMFYNKLFLKKRNRNFKQHAIFQEVSALTGINKEC
jgi:hypothetical protein